MAEREELLEEIVLELGEVADAIGALPDGEHRTRSLQALAETWDAIDKAITGG